MNLLLTLLSMSISASMLFLLYLAARRWLSNHLPPSARHALLLIIVLRLLLPYSPAFSLMNRLPAWSDMPSAAREDSLSSSRRENASVPPAHSGMNETNAAPRTETAQIPETTPPTALSRSDSPTAIPWNAIAVTVWLTGVCAAFGSDMVAYFVCRRRLLHAAQDAPYCADLLAEIAGGGRIPAVMVASGTGTPMLLGFFRPVIILPREIYTAHELRHILTHEWCHYRRRDIAVKWIVSTACALHWFNPLTRPLRRELDDLCEMACDRAATLDMSSGERRAYIRTLLETAGRQVTARSIPVTPLSGEARRLDERLAAIANQKQTSVSGKLLSITAIAFAVCVAMLLGAYGARQINRSAADPREDTSVSQSDRDIYDNYNYAVMSYNIRESNPPQDERTADWLMPPFGEDNTEYGYTTNPALMRTVFDLLYWENHTYLGKQMSSSASEYEGDHIEVVFDSEIRFRLEKGGYLLIQLEGYESDLLVMERYPSLLAPTPVDSNDPDGAVNGVCVFRLPDEIYDQLFDLLFDNLVSHDGHYVRADEASLSHEDDSFDGSYTENGRYVEENDIVTVKNGQVYRFSDIDDDIVYTALSDKIRIFSESYSCDFTADVGSDAYTTIWRLFGNMESYNEIQPPPKEEIASSATLIIVPDGCDTDNSAVSVTVYADCDAVCAGSMGRERWFAMPKDWRHICRQIAAMQSS